MSNLLTSKQFDELCEYLEGPEGCNFRERIPGDANSITWTCDGTLAMTEAWLTSHDHDVEANLERMRQLGGHCDCEVLFNVVDNWEEQQ